jgi:hypothetical protein
VGTLGTTGRNLLRGPGFFNIDENVRVASALTKESSSYSLSAKPSNLTNTPSFYTPTPPLHAPTLNADGSVRSYGNYR